MKPTVLEVVSVPLTQSNVYEKRLNIEVYIEEMYAHMNEQSLKTVFRVSIQLRQEMVSNSRTEEKNDAHVRSTV